MMLALGFISLLAALFALIMHLKTSYDTQGGSQGQVPCIAAATIQVPLLTMAGLVAPRQSRWAV